MRRTALFILLLANRSLAQTPGASASAVTLRQCYDWALAQSEELKLRQEDIEQSHQRARAAMGGIFPRLDWEFVDTWQDSSGVNRLASQGFSGFIEKEQLESRFILRQPLFSGFKEFSALSGFQREGARDNLRLQRAARELFAAVAGAFYGVLGLESERGNTRASSDLALARVKDLQNFLRLGKARDSEVFTAQARAAALMAALRQVEARIASAREELSFLTGQDLSGQALKDEIGDHPPVGGLKDAVAKALERADVRAQKESVAAQEMRVRYEKGSYWPSLDLLGRYYTKRATFLREIKWDVALSLDIPIFHGGTTTADVRRAASAYRQSLLALEELKRRIVHLIRKTHGEFVSALEEARAQEEAVQAAWKSHDSLLEEYRLGLATNLEVLQAMDLLRAQQNARDAARLKVKLLFLRLGAATETMP